MTIQIQQAKRKIIFKNITIPDPGPEFSIEEVRQIVAARMPDIITAVVEGPTVVGDTLTYKFITNTGSKGLRHSRAVQILAGKVNDKSVMDLAKIVTPEVNESIKLIEVLVSGRSNSIKLELESHQLPPLF